MERKRKIFILTTIGIIMFFSTSVSVSHIKDIVTLPKILESPQFKPYKFIAYGDTRPKGDDNSGLEKCVGLIEDLMKEHEIEFILHTGDIVDYGGTQDDYDTYYWPLMGPINETVPIYYAVGNHEYNQRSGGYDLDLSTYLANVNNPGNEIYYSFNTPQNDIHFIVLNSDYYFYDNNVALQEEQQTWLEADLSSNTIDRIVAMIHRPYWGVNPSRVVSEYEVLRPIWHDFLVENGVDLVFNGHDHHFYHTVRNGTHYTVTGGGTAALYVPIPDHPDVNKTLLEDDFFFMDNHVCLVEVTESGLNIDVIVTNGTTVYQFFVDAAAPDIYSPMIDSPEDVVFTEGTTGNTISWTAIDLHPKNYSIYQDGNVIDEDVWTNGTPIEYVIDDLSVGEYNLTIVVRDVNGNNNKDTVLVTVEAAETTSTSTSESSESSETTSATSNISGIEIFLFGIVFYLYYKRRKSKDRKD